MTWAPMGKSATSSAMTPTGKCLNHRDNVDALNPFHPIESSRGKFGMPVVSYLDKGTVLP